MKINLIKRLNNEQIKFIEEATKETIEDKEYTKEEITIYERKIVEYGIEKSIKKGEMDIAMKEINTILNSL